MAATVATHIRDDEFHPSTVCKLGSTTLNSDELESSEARLRQPPVGPVPAFLALAYPAPVGLDRERNSAELDGLGFLVGAVVDFAPTEIRSNHVEDPGQTRVVADEGLDRWRPKSK